MSLDNWRWVKKVDSDGVIRNVIEFYDVESSGREYNNVTVDPRFSYKPRSDALEKLESRGIEIATRLEENYRREQERLERQVRESEENYRRKQEELKKMLQNR